MMKLKITIGALAAALCAFASNELASSRPPTPIPTSLTCADNGCKSGWTTFEDGEGGTNPCNVTDVLIDSGLFGDNHDGACNCYDNICSPVAGAYCRSHVTITVVIQDGNGPFTFCPKLGTWGTPTATTISTNLDTGERKCSDSGASESSAEVYIACGKNVNCNSLVDRDDAAYVVGVQASCWGCSDFTIYCPH